MAGSLNKSALARKLGISRSSLYYESKMNARDEAARVEISEVLASNPFYGHKRISIELGMNRKKVLRVMKKYGLNPRSRKSKGFAKPGDVGLPAAGYRNEMAGMCPASPNVVWCGDFTYIRFRGSFVYLATVIDSYTREILGFSLSRRHNRFLAKSAVLDAIRKRGALPRYFHSDQGSEYQSYEHAAFLEKLGVTVSMSAKASPWQNPFQESFYSRFKLELGNVSQLESDGQLAEAIYRQIYYYNNERIHSVLKMSPREFYRLAAQRSAN